MSSPGAARFVAPVSLLAAFTAVVLIITGSGTSPQSSSALPAPPLTRTAPKSHHHYWIVHKGQTLSEIAGRTGVPAARIRALNPGKDLDTLQPGQRVKVR